MQVDVEVSQTPVVVELSLGDGVIEVSTPSRLIDVQVRQPIGTPGPPGDPGPAGGTYLHTQGAPALVWHVPHNLGFMPNAQPLDSAFEEFDANIVHVDENNLIVTLTILSSGFVICS